MSISSVTTFFQSALSPVPPFNSPELPSLSALDFLGALRLSIALRQLRRRVGVEPSKTWIHDLWMTLVVVFGGEIVASVLLATPPSFMFSPTVTLLFVASHTVANLLPTVPVPALDTELPLAVLDAATRSMLVCDFAYSLVKNNASPLIQNSPMALLITSTVLGNGGFFFVNAFSMLSPSGWALSVPPELQPWGWTTMDLWIAPLATAVYATTAQLQPFWVQLQELLLSFLGSSFEESASGSGVIKPMSTDDARSLCFVMIAVLFSGRAISNFGGEPAKPPGSKRTVVTVTHS